MIVQHRESFYVDLRARHARDEGVIFFSDIAHTKRFDIMLWSFSRALRSQPDFTRIVLIRIHETQKYSFPFSRIYIQIFLRTVKIFISVAREVGVTERDCLKSQAE